jgi:hypothetical protein
MIIERIGRIDRIDSIDVYVERETRKENMGLRLVEAKS